jgi:tetratricopeptide (TPR) repeat protein
MREHPDRETLQQFISGQLTSEDARLTDRHLSVCSECRDRADEISEWLALQLLDSWMRPSYDEAFERAADRVADRLAGILEEGRNSEDLVAELLEQSAPERRRRITSEERFQTIRLSQLLRSRSRETWTVDPSAALELADLSVEVARHLDSGRYGTCLVEDSRAAAWAYLGNTFRINSDLWRAEQALRQAWLHHLSAGEDAYTEAELLSFTSSLRNTQGLCEEAIKLADRAIAIYREGQDHSLEGIALIQKGAALGGLGCNQEAISVIRAGLDKVDPIESPRVALAGKHNLIWSLCNGGSPAEAWKALERSRPFYLDLGHQMDLARLRWLEGQIAMDLRWLGKAESILYEVREVFVDCSCGVEVFLISVDLAQISALIGQHQKVKVVLGELIPLGEALGLSKAVFKARLLYEQASRG